METPSRDQAEQYKHDFNFTTVAKAVGAPAVKAEVGGESASVEHLVTSCGD
jgi:hypothetical protein